MIGQLVFVTVLMGGPWSPKLPPWPDVDRRSPRLVAKLEKRKKARHQAAQQGRQEFDAQFAETMRILNTPPIPARRGHSCPCDLFGG